MRYSFAEIREIIAIAKEAGLRELWVDDIHVIPTPTLPEMTEQDLSKLADPLATPTGEDEVKFWSAGGAGFKGVKGEDILPPLTGEGDGA